MCQPGFVHLRFFSGVRSAPRSDVSEYAPFCAPGYTYVNIFWNALSAPLQLLEYIPDSELRRNTFFFKRIFLSKFLVGGLREVKNKIFSSAEE